MLVDMNLEPIPSIPYNSEENGIAERFNFTEMNTAMAALAATGMNFQYGT